MLAVLPLSACNEDTAGPSDPCAMGICAFDAGGSTGTSDTGTNGTNTSGTNTSGTTGTNTSGTGTNTTGTSGTSTSGTTSSTTSGTTSGTSGGSGTNNTTGSGCVESWLCSPWETDGTNDQAMRTCTDQNACGTTANRPATDVTLPALSFAYYQCNVEPILDRGCSQLACHGVEDVRALRVYHRGRHRIPGMSIQKTDNCSRSSFTTDECIGALECSCWTTPKLDVEFRRNFDSARGFALDAQGNAVANVDDAELLTQPLIGGGLAHAGIKFWRNGDADYNTIRDWLAGASQSSCGLPMSEN